MRRKIFVLFLLLALVVLSLSTTQAVPTPKIKGKWHVNGRTATGQAYTGTVNVAQWWGATWVYGRYNLTDDEKLFSFFTGAEFDGKTLTFDFDVSDVPGVAGVLGSLLNEDGEIPEGTKANVKATYALSGQDLFRGSWKANRGSFSGLDNWTRDGAKMAITSVDPSEVETGPENVVLTINGTNLPGKDELKPSDISFLLDGKADEKIKVTEILEVDDGGTSMQVKVNLAKDAAKGKRDVKIKETLGEELLTIKKPTKKLPLGGSVDVSAGETVRIYIPNSEGGTLTIKGPEGLKLHKDSESGEEVKANDKGAYEVTASGWYYIDLSATEASAGTSLSSKYVIEAEVPAEKRPWNFWYYPFVESYSTGRNLFKDGELYSKLDKLFGLKPEKDGWKKFDPQKHMDWWAPKYTRDKIFKKIYEANPEQDWDKLNDLRSKLLDLQKKMASATGDEKKKMREEFNKSRDEYWETQEKYKKGFKLDGLSEEDKKLYNPTTIQGFGYSYLRSKDSNKSWWGHCWGAVIASSLWTRPPEAKTVKGADGEDIKFTQEDLEAMLVDYYTNHSVSPTNYMSECPPGPPKEEKNQGCDSYPDDFWIGLMTGIRKNQLPLAINIRASSVGSGKGTQVWNQVVGKFKAELKEIKGDETHIQIKLEVGYSKDHYPSSEDSYGTVRYTIVLKFNQNGSVDRDNLKYQNWISASAYAPSYLWRIERSSSPMKTDNEILRGRLDKLVETFGFKQVK